MERLTSIKADIDIHEFITKLVDEILQQFESVMLLDKYELKKVLEREREIIAGVFKTVLAALREHRTVGFEYRSLQQRQYTHRSADPYHAICQQGNWYVIGYCHEREELRMFALSRMRNAVLTDEAFTIPDGFNPHEYFDKEMGV